MSRPILVYNSDKKTNLVGSWAVSLDSILKIVSVARLKLSCPLAQLVLSSSPTCLVLLPNLFVLSSSPTCLSCPPAQLVLSSSSTCLVLLLNLSCPPPQLVLSFCSTCLVLLLKLKVEVVCLHKEREREELEVEVRLKKTLLSAMVEGRAVCDGRNLPLSLPCPRQRGSLRRGNGRSMWRLLRLLQQWALLLLL